MRARGAVLPSAEGRSANAVGWAAQARPGAGTEVSAPHIAARRAWSIAEIIEVCLANELFRSADAAKVIERVVTNRGAGAGLSEGLTGGQ